MFYRLCAVFIFAAGVCPNAIATSDYTGEWEKVRKTVLNPCKPRAMDVVDSYLHYLDVPDKSMGVQQQSELAMDLLFFIATGTLYHMSFIASTPEDWTPEKLKTFGISTHNATPPQKQILVQAIVVTAYYLQNYAPHFQHYLESVKITSRKKTNRENRHFNCVIGTFKHAMQKLGVQAFEQPDPTSLRAVRKILSLNSSQGLVPLDTFMDEVLERYRPRSPGTESLAATSPPTSSPPPPPPLPSARSPVSRGLLPVIVKEDKERQPHMRGDSMQDILLRRLENVRVAVTGRGDKGKGSKDGEGESASGTDVGSERLSSVSRSDWSEMSEKHTPPKNPPPQPPSQKVGTPTPCETLFPHAQPPKLPEAVGTEQKSKTLPKTPPRIPGTQHIPLQPAQTPASPGETLGNTHKRSKSSVFNFWRSGGKTQTP